MRPNPLRKIWASGGAVVNGWLTIPNTFAAETMAHQGWDSLTVDLQHGIVDYQAAVELFTAVSTTSTVPMARAPWLTQADIMKLLDAGAYGLICPMVSTVEDAENLVNWTNYPPKGTRSYGPIRALLYGGADYPQHANDEVVALAMIETREGVDNLDEILRVPGLEAVYIGPSDLSLALGCSPSFDDVAPPVAEAIQMIVSKTREAGKIAGIHCGSTTGAKRRIDQGFQLVTISSDSRLIAAGSQQIIAEMRSETAETGEGY